MLEDKLLAAGYVLDEYIELLLDLYDEEDSDYLRKFRLLRTGEFLAEGDLVLKVTDNDEQVNLCVIYGDGVGFIIGPEDWPCWRRIELRVA